MILAVPDGKPLADRTVEVDPFPVLAALIARPPRNTRQLDFTDPGPAAEQGRVDVPVRPGEGR